MVGLKMGLKVMGLQTQYFSLINKLINQFFKMFCSGSILAQFNLFLPSPSDSPVSDSLVTGIKVAWHHSLKDIFSRGSILLSLSGWSLDPDFMIHLPCPPKIPGFQAWATRPGTRFIIL